MGTLPNNPAHMPEQMSNLRDPDGSRISRKGRRPVRDIPNETNHVAKGLN
jgi:hypothetical protein